MAQECCGKCGRYERRKSGLGKVRLKHRSSALRSHGDLNSAHSQIIVGYSSNQAKPIPFRRVFKPKGALSKAIELNLGGAALAEKPRQCLFRQLL
jgi:hypothetical protein